MIACIRSFIEHDAWTEGWVWELGDRIGVGFLRMLYGKIAIPAAQGSFHKRGCRVDKARRGKYCGIGTPMVEFICCCRSGIGKVYGMTSVVVVPDVEAVPVDIGRL